MAKLIEITGKAISGEWGSDDEAGMGVPILRTTNFTNDGVINFDNVVTRTITKKNISDKYLRCGDIIIEKSGGSDKQPVGRVVYYEGADNIYLFNNFTGLLRIRDRNIWNSKYVFYALYRNYCQGGTQAFENRTTGLHNLKLDDFVSKVDIREAPLPIQEQICSVIDRVRLIIAIRKQQLNELDNLVKARFVEMFGDPVSNPKGWQYENMKAVCKKITDGEHGSVDKVERGHPFLNAKHIKSSGDIDWDTVTYTSDAVHERIYKRCNPERGDILMTTTGTIGNVAVISMDKEAFTMDRGITLLKLDDTKVKPLYIAWLLRQESMQNFMRSKVHASAIGHLFLNKVEQLPVMRPDMGFQDRFSAFVTQVDKSKVAVQAALDEAQTLFDSLMQQYFG